jgi:FAD-linked oxidoreductase
VRMKAAPEYRVWRNWAGTASAAPVRWCRPRSEAEIAAAVKDAGAAGLTVRALGSGHSFTAVAATSGVALDLSGWAGITAADTRTGLVTARSGTPLRALNAELSGLGLAMANLGDIDVQTLAGALATGTHGTGARLGGLATQVEALDLILADGSAVSCSAAARPELFAAARVGLGALGVVAEVTLRCVPAFTLRGIDEPAPLQQTLERFEQLALGNDHFEFFVFPYAETALTRTNNRTDEPPRPRGRVAAYANDVLLTNHAFGAFCRIARRLPGAIPQINRLVTRLAGRSERVERSASIFASPRLVRFTEMEYALPRERTPEAVRRVMEMIESRGLAVPFPIEVRTAAPDDAFLSTAAGRETGYVAVHMFAGMQWRDYFERVEAIMSELDGRPHWGKRHFQTAATLRGRYPEWDRFQAVRTRLDPTGMFTNAWTDRVLGPVSA